MNILTNWIFWVIIAAIVFVLAIIGYLSESKKKNKKSEIENVSTNNASGISNEESINNSADLNQSTISSQVADLYNNPAEVSSASISQVAQAEPVSMVETPVVAPAEPVSTIETPVVTPAEPVSAANVDATIEPASVFTANLDQPVSSTPTVIPADAIPPVTPAPIPSTNAEVKADNLSTGVNDNIETL